jgi:hypothetical protein
LQQDNCKCKKIGHLSVNDIHFTPDLHVEYMAIDTRNTGADQFWAGISILLSYPGEGREFSNIYRLIKGIWAVKHFQAG